MRRASAAGGPLLCAVLAVSGCVDSGFCGNGRRDEAEVCDGDDLGGASCASLGFGAGTLRCRAGCGDFDRSQCGAPTTCGNVVIDGPERCDGTQLGGATCASLGLGNGALRCAANCAELDTSLCGSACVPMCEMRACGPDPVCGTSCGACAGSEVCEEGQCQPPCDLPPITSDGIIDYDLRTVTVSGTVTLDAQVMPNDAIVDGTARGYVVFTDRASGSEISASLGESGAAHYSVVLPAGTYDVEIWTSHRSDQSVLPSSVAIAVRDAVALTSDGVLDHDVRTLTVSGTVTLDGSLMPDDAIGDGIPRGAVVFTDAATGSEIAASLGESGTAHYSIVVPAGTYEVQLRTNSYSDQSVLPPSGSVAVRDGIALSRDGVLDYDLRTVRVSGSVTLNGSLMPDDAIDDGIPRGGLVFIDRATGSESPASFRESGPAHYDIVLPAGTYDVQLRTNSDRAQSVLPPTVYVAVRDGLALTSSGVLDYDLRTVIVSGTVTLNGSPMPDDAIDDGIPRGGMVFIDRVTGRESHASFSESGPAHYSIVLPAGTYDVQLRTNSDRSQSVLPRAVIVAVRGGIALSSDGVLDYDLRTVRVSGTVTLNGSPVPDDTIRDGFPRGGMRFRDRATGSEITASFGESGAAQYSLVLPAGTYDVEVRTNDSAYQSVLPSATTVSVRDGVALNSDGVVDYDVQTVTVSGTVTLNGAVMPDDSTLDGIARGYMVFTDRATGSGTAASLRETSAAHYSVVLSPGVYDVALRTSARDDQSVLPPAIVVGVHRGCVP